MLGERNIDKWICNLCSLFSFIWRAFIKISYANLNSWLLTFKITLRCYFKIIILFRKFSNQIYLSLTLESAATGAANTGITSLSPRRYASLSDHKLLQRWAPGCSLRHQPPGGKTFTNFPWKRAARGLPIQQKILPPYECCLENAGGSEKKILNSISSRTMSLACLKQARNVP